MEAFLLCCWSCVADTSGLRGVVSPGETSDGVTGRGKTPSMPSGSEYPASDIAQIARHSLTEAGKAIDICHESQARSLLFAARCLSPKQRRSYSTDGLLEKPWGLPRECPPTLPAICSRSNSMNDGPRSKPFCWSTDRGWAQATLASFFMGYSPKSSGGGETSTRQLCGGVSSLGDCSRTGLQMAHSDGASIST